MLSSNSNRLKSLGRVTSVLLLGALAAGCSSGSAPTTYDLSAPTSRIGGSAGVQISVNEPAALQSLSTQQILVKDPTGAISFLGAGQWADNLPRLIQTRLINTFENASQLRGVSRPSSGAVADVQLISELRSFEISTPDQRGLRGDVGEDRERGDRADRQCAHFPGPRSGSLGGCRERGPARWIMPCRS